MADCISALISTSYRYILVFFITSSPGGVLVIAMSISLSVCMSVCPLA